MNIKKNILRSVASLLLLGLSFAACTSSKEDALSNSAGQELRLGSVETELTLEANVGEEARAMSFQQFEVATPERPKLHPILDEDGVDVLCIVRSDDPADEPIIRKIKFERNKNITNRIHLKEHRFRFPEGTTLKPGKKWYIMGVIGGTWDEAQKRLSFQTNVINTAYLHKFAEVDAPAISKWVEIPTDAKGEFIFPPHGTEPQCIKIPFHAQGALVRHSVGETGGQYKSFTVVTTAFAFGGYYDLSQIPTVDAELGHKHSGLLNFVRTGHNENVEYPVTHVDVKEYTHKYTMPEGIGLTNDYTAVFWVMPTGTPAEHARTNVFVEGDMPSPFAGEPAYVFKRLPVYGKHHTKVLRNGDQVHLQSEVYRPVYPIEYMAEYNVKRKGDPANWDKEGTTKENGSSGVFASNHGAESMSFLTWGEAKNAGIAGYHLPTLEEWESVLLAGKNLDFKNINIRNLQVKTKVGAGAVETTNVQVLADGDRTAYAIHFINSGGNNQRRVAYRYRYTPNPALDANKMIPAAVVVEENDRFVLNTPTDRHQDQASNSPAPKQGPFNYPLIFNQYMQVDMIYLGEAFLGSIQDLASESWWSHAERKQDIITRYLPTTGQQYAFVLYDNPQSINNNSTSSAYFAWNALYWLDREGFNSDDDPKKVTGLKRWPQPENYASMLVYRAKNADGLHVTRYKHRNYVQARLFKNAASN